MTATDLSDLTLLAAAAVADVAPDPSGRTITGICAVYGAVGNSSAGPTRFTAGAISLPQDLSRVKLLLDHDATDPLGYMESARVEGDRLIGTFKVASGDRGDLALAQATDKRRDALSVGCGITDWHKEGNTLVVTGATLSEVSLVSIPAFADARVLEVRSHRKDNIMDRTTLEAAETAEAPTVVEAFAPADVITVADPAAPVVTAAAPVLAAPPVVTAVRRRNGLDELVSLTAAYLSKNDAAGLAPYLTAALSDVVPANEATGYGVNSETWVGELFQLANYRRPILDSLTKTPLTSLKMKGWKWVARPQVAKYAGNKAAIPSNPVDRDPAEWPAQRFAGGWDVDRVFIDLPGGSDMIRDLFVEATKDYLLKSEAYAVERLLAEGTTVSTESTTAITTLFSTVASDFRTLGGRADLLLLSPEYFSKLEALTEANAPWFLRGNGQINAVDGTGTYGNLRFEVGTGMAANTAIAIDTRTVKAQEGVPGAQVVKVQALNIANGGIDIAVFGYVAVGVTDARGVRVYKDTTP